PARGVGRAPLGASAGAGADDGCVVERRLRADRGPDDPLRQALRQHVQVRAARGARALDAAGGARRGKCAAPRLPTGLSGATGRHLSSTSGAVTMNDRQTPPTRAPDGSVAPVAPEPVELDLRDHDNGRDRAAFPHDPEPAPLLPDGELLSRRQASERFGLDAGTLRRLERPGGLTPCRKTARGPVYYAVEDLERVVSEYVPEVHVPDGDGAPATAGLVLPPDRLWAMV